MLGNKAATTIGPESWRNSTLKGIKLSQTIVQKSDKSCDVGRSLDPLPHLRDTVAQLSNDEIHRYSREVRVIVAKLRESLLDTNEEIKSLTRGKEALEKALEHTRKDIALNKDSQEVRISRPAREREHDGADDLLNAERAHLLNCKKALEAQLRSVQQQLQVLDAARRRLFNVLNERSRVMDLLNHSLSSANIGSQSAPSGMGRSRTSLDGRLSRLHEMSGQPDPLGPYTPEADQALVDSEEARARSAYLRRELKEAIDRTEKLQKAAHKSVNDGLTQKVAETITLKQHLGVGLGENRHGIHRAQRWYDATDKARGYTMGPVAYSDISTRERLDRPMVKVFQRHPGTQLPEAQEIIRSGDGLLQSLTATSRNIGLLKLSQLRLRNDIKGKSMASSVDGSIIRLRRRKSDHRWTLGEAF
ncbi:coiled-coil domain-containing protein 105-like isoform X2 [Ostrea edulis]|uniref:coiled-coil domain-containing protein 105-like isoform X2 n=1 Tax=Ostrea edulis TaxID=37623 RepID=UPI0020951E4D|nr:coiled-coil domain-containing protein 105-like isoform X2 [Ostrea edulis]